MLVAGVGSRRLEARRISWWSRYRYSAQHGSPLKVTTRHGFITYAGAGGSKKIVPGSVESMRHGQKAGLEGLLSDILYRIWNVSSQQNVLPIVQSCSVLLQEHNFWDGVPGEKALCGFLLEEHA